MKKQNNSEKYNLKPELKKEKTKYLRDDQDKNRIEFGTQEPNEGKEELEVSEETTNTIKAYNINYRPYKVSKRMSQKE